MAIKFLNTVAVDTDVLYVDASSNRVGIGTTSPSHLLTLETASSPGLKIKDTTQGATLLAFSQDSNSHIGTYSSHPLVFDTNSTERMRITSAGNVGIGTTSPAGPLTIANANNGNWNDGLIIDDPTGWAATVYKRSNVPKMFTGLYSGNDNYIWMSTGYDNTGTTITAPRTDAVLMARPGTDDLQIYLDTHFGGNVGIGTTSPGRKLTIEGGGFSMFADGGTSADLFSVVTHQYTFSDENEDAVYSYNGTDGHEFSTGGTPRVNIKQNGNVGIGTTSPSGTLNIRSVSSTGSEYNLLSQNNSGTQLFYVRNDGVVVVSNNYFYVTSSQGAYFDGSIKARGGITDDGGTLGLGGGGSTSHLNILSSGSVGIGTTSPSAKLDVDGVIRSRGGSYAADVDTRTDVGLIIPENDFIYTADSSSYLRKLIGKSSDIISIGETGTSLIDGINLLPGTTGGYVQIYNNASVAAKFVDGKLGIGTTSPSTKLQISTSMSSGPTSNIFLDVDGTNTNGGGGSIIFATSASAGTTSTYNAKITGTRASGGAGGDSQLGFWTTLVSDSTSPQQRMTITKEGDVGIGTTSPTYKLDVIGGARAGGVVTYSKTYTSLDTTGNAVAGLTTGSNGNSAGFTFTCFGHGGYQKVVYSCYNVSGTWNTIKVIDEGTNAFDVEASANATTITFTFKTVTGTKSYTPRVTVEATGTSINNTYA